MKYNKKSGFTLIELLVVMVILATISLMAYTQYAGIIKNAREDVIAASLIAISGDIDVFEMERGGLIGYTEDEWKDFQKYFFKKKPIIHANQKIVDGTPVYYSKKTNTEGDEEYCIGFLAKTEKYKLKAKEDGGSSDDYYEFCNTGETIVDITDTSNRMLIKNTFY